MIGADAATVHRGAFTLGPVSLRIAPGEHVLLMGPSGAGKSTLINLLAGFVPLAGGDLWLRGTRVNDWDARRRGCGWVPQGPVLFPHMTVRQNIAFGVRRRPRSATRVEEVAALFGLEPLLQRRPGELSGGEAQRVALARAVAPEPHVLLLDEPFASLDPATRQTMHGALAQAHKALNFTVLHATHDGAAGAWASRILWLHQGQLTTEPQPAPLP